MAYRTAPRCGETFPRSLKSNSKHLRMERRRISSRARLWTEGLLWTVGCVLLGYGAFVYVSAQLAQNQGNRALEHEVPSENSAASINHPEGSLMGRVEIPRIHLSAIVFEGTSDSTLERG